MKPYARRYPFIFLFPALLAFSAPAPGPAKGPEPLLSPENVSALGLEAGRDPLSAYSMLQAGFDGAAPRTGPVRLSPEVFAGFRSAPPPLPPAQAGVVRAAPAPVPAAPPGLSARGTLVLVQIDGLSYNRLREALSKGRAGNLAGMLSDGGFRLSPYLCGMPSVTMSVQSQIFFGRTLPGNEWFSKAADKEVTGGVVEDKLPPGAGLLSGGQAFLSELSGGAEKGANINVWLERDGEKYGGILSKAAELWRSAPYLLRAGSFPGLTFWKDWRRMKKDFEERKYDTPTDKYAPVYVSLLTNFGAAIAESGIKKAILDGAPSVYADFSGFDEKAHYYGSFSDEAFDEVERIDRRIGAIMETARERGARVFVFSDHGQTPSETFVGKFGKKPQELVDELALQAEPGYKAGGLVFGHVYSLGNIYVRGTTGHLEVREMEKRYPGLIAKLAAHPGVGAVAARDGGGVAVFSRKGGALIGPGADRAPEDGDPLAPYLDERMTREILSAQLLNYMNLEESGDLVVLAPYENGSTIDYNTKYTLVSEHGGIGGEQMHPFMIYDPRLVQMDPGSLIDARGLHGIFSALLK